MESDDMLVPELFNQPITIKYQAGISCIKKLFYGVQLRLR